MRSYYSPISSKFIHVGTGANCTLGLLQLRMQVLEMMDMQVIYKNVTGLLIPFVGL